MNRNIFLFALALFFGCFVSSASEDYIGQWIYKHPKPSETDIEVETLRISTDGTLGWLGTFPTRLWGPVHSVDKNGKFHYPKYEIENEILKTYWFEDGKKTYGMCFALYQNGDQAFLVEVDQNGTVSPRRRIFSKLQQGEITNSDPVPLDPPSAPFK